MQVSYARYFSIRDNRASYSLSEKAILKSWEMCRIFAGAWREWPVCMVR